MDFFGRQDWARKRTRWLVALFILAVIALVMAVNIGSYLAASLGGPILLSSKGEEIVTLRDWFTGAPFLWVSLATVLVIGLGSGINWLQVAGGGTSVAKMVGARRVSSNTQDSDERRLMNVVEEMSIAAGTPVPQLYVMDNEAGINAFVAGLKNHDTVLVVTKGALQQLNRQELQGVIGHEYSHILHGDMRLNVHLMGVLAGILLIGQLGEFILRHLRYSGGGRSGGKDKNGGVAAILALGVSLLVIGYLGLFFGRLIKAGVSRQREFLADASAVQFTRDNTGIAGALAHIQVHSGQSLLMSAHAEDMSHMCFGESVQVKMSGMLATHPPLRDRIKALGFTPDVMIRQAAARVQSQREEAQAALAAQAAQAQKNAAAKSAVPGFGHGTEVIGTAAIMASMGTVQPEQLERAEQVLNTLSNELKSAAHDPTQVSSVLVALMQSLSGYAKARVDSGPFTDGNDVQQQHVEALLQKYLSEKERQTLPKMVHTIERLSSELKFSLLNLCKPALQQMSLLHRQQTLLCLLALARADGKFLLSEFVMYTLARQWALPKKHQGSVLTRFSSVEKALVAVLGAVFITSTAQGDQATPTWVGVLRSFELAANIPIPDKFDAAALDESLDTLDRLSPLLKRPLINSLVDMIVADENVSIDEETLLRAICERLNVPMPMLPVAK